MLFYQNRQKYSACNVAIYFELWIQLVQCGLLYQQRKRKHLKLLLCLECFLSHTLHVRVDLALSGAARSPKALAHFLLPVTREDTSTRPLVYLCWSSCSKQHPNFQVKTETPPKSHRLLLATIGHRHHGPIDDGYIRNSGLHKNASGTGLFYKEVQKAHCYVLH